MAPNQTRLLAVGAAPELLAALRVVEDSGVGGRPRFSPAVQRQLHRMILGRHFGPALLELAYFVLAAIVADGRRGRYERALWGPAVAETRQFRAAFAACGPPVGVTADRVTVSTSDGVFGVAFSRMPILAALAEFAVTTVGYEAFDAMVAPLSEKVASSHAIVSSVANALGRTLNDWLGQRLDSYHVQRRIRMMADRLRSARREAVDPQLILAAWCDWSAQSQAAELGLRLYRTVWRGFAELQEALDLVSAQSRIEVAVPLGADRNAGEVDVDADEALLAALDAEAEILAALEQPPLSHVKFLTRIEIGQLAAIAAAGRNLDRLRLAFLRDQVWGDVQARIVEAQRRRNSWSSETDGRYDAVLKTFADLQNRIERIAYASLQVLIEERQAEAVDLMLALEPDLDLTSAARTLPSGVGALPSANLVDRFLVLFRMQPDILGPSAAALAKRAERESRLVARKGFGPGPRNVETMAAFSAMALVMPRLLAIARHGAALSGFLADARAQFDEDVPVFRSQFHAIYGEPA